MIDPWGTPHVIAFGPESCPLIKHCCTLLFKYDSNHFIIEFPLFRRNYAFCLTVSRDLWNQRLF